MKRFLVVALAVSWFAGTALTARAQDQASSGPPKVLVIYRETEKYGRHTGHVKNEVAFAQAYAASKSPGRFLAITAMSGPGEVWFLTMFDSYDAFEKTNKFDAQSSLQGQLQRLSEQDAEYVSEATQMVARYDEKSSYGPNIDISKMRYFEVTTIRLRPGHDKEWQDLVSFYKATAEKAKLDETDSFFEVTYGAPAGTILIITPRHSLAEVDAAAASKAFQDALGESGQKKWAELVQASAASVRNDLYSFSPEMSYVPEAWITGDPSYWKPKAPAAAKAVAPGTKKPAAAPAAKP
jgi:hypothetical protein